MKRGVLMGLVILLVFLPSVFAATTGTANVSVTTENEPPTWIQIPNHTWAQNSVLTYMLTNYSSDRENYTLVYSSTNPNNITVSIGSDGNVSFTPDTDFTGNRSIVFYAYDYRSLVASSITYLEVNSTVLPAEDGDTTSTTTTIVSGGGGGTRTVYVNVTDEDEEENEETSFAPSVDSSCVEEKFFFEDLQESNVAVIELNICGQVFLGSSSDTETDLSSVFLKDFSKDLANLLFYRTDGQVMFYSLDEGEIQELDEDGNEVPEYYLMIGSWDYDESVIIQIEKVDSEELVYFAPLYQDKKIWSLMILLVLIPLLVILYLVLKKLDKF
jgi:hypothetical protein